MRVKGLGRFRQTYNQGLLIILGPAGGDAGIAPMNILLVGSLRRRREFVAAQLLGATPRQIRQMILYESLLVGLAALSIAGGIILSSVQRRASVTGRCRLY